jgi:hypothetical protein
MPAPMTMMSGEREFSSSEFTPLLTAQDRVTESGHLVSSYGFGKLQEGQGFTRFGR